MPTTQSSFLKVLSIFATLALALPLASQKIGGRIQVSNITDCNTVDTAYSSYQDSSLVVWAQQLAPYYTIRAQRVKSDGKLIGGPITIATSPVPKWHPAVAYVAKANRFLVVWQERIGGLWTIQGKTVHPSSGATSSTAELVSSASDSVEPDIGGDINVVESEAILVWRREGSGIYTRQVTVSAFGPPVRSILMNRITVSPNDSLPTISKSGGKPHTYMVAWKREMNPSDLVYAKSLTKDGLPRGLVVLLGNDLRAGPPDIDGDGEFFVATWANLQGNLTTDRHVSARMLRYNGTSGISWSATVSVSGVAGVDQGDPAVGFLSNKFAIVWSEEFSASKKQISMQMYAPTAMHKCGPKDAFRGSRNVDVRPAIGSLFAGGSEKNEALVAYISEASGGVVDAQRIRTTGNGGPVQNLGGGCGLGGLASTDGPFAVGNSEFRVELSGGPLGLLPVYFNIAPTGPALLSCGLCQISNPTIILSRIVKNGGTSFRLPIPCDHSLLNQSVQFQFFIFDTGTTPCSLLPGMSFSNRLEAKLGW